MSDGTKIEWADATLNYVNGCTRVSPGCGQGGQGGCYAERLAGTRLRNHPTRIGLTRQTTAGPRWTGEVRLHEPALTQGLKWKRGRRIFWNAHGDLFHENVPDEAIDRLFAICALTPQHTHMILTKRSARMREYCSLAPATKRERWRAATEEIVASVRGNLTEGLEQLGTGMANVRLPNVWLGVSVEDQARKSRIDDLRATPAALRFLSCEPLLENLGEVDLTGIGWVIVGGESGPGARPMHPDWARSLRDQCAAAGVPFHFKQWGEWAPFDGQRRSDHVLACDGGIMEHVGKHRAGRLLDGREHSAFPA